MSYHLRRYKNSQYWYARITYPDGSRGNWRSTRKERKGDAKRVGEQWDRAATSNDPVVTIEEAYQKLAEHMRRKKDADTTMQLLSDRASHVTSFLGREREIHTIQLADTEAYLDHRRCHTRTLKSGREVVRHAADITIAAEFNFLMAALKRCHALGLYKGNWHALWPEALPKTYKGCTRWLPWEEYLALLEAMEPHWRDHLIVYVSTGVRLAELYTLHARGVRDGRIAVAGTKTEGAKRSVPLSVEATEAIARRVAASPDGFLFQRADAWSTQRKNWLRALARGCRRAKIEHTTTNDLRRTFVSWCWHRGVDERVVIGWMGHTSSKMVREVYAQASSEQEQREIAKLPTRHLPPSPERPTAPELLN